jgi:DNA repair photolyase
MSNSIIYEPKGRAREYAPLACNLAVGCKHGCLYCYGPGATHRTREVWDQPVPAKDYLGRFRKDAERLEGDEREILFSFSTDPCQDEAAVARLAEVLDVAEVHRLRVEVLTKNPANAVPLFPILERNGWGLGTTVCFVSEALREEWEPNAPPIASRLSWLGAAKAAGIRTWASVEPVVDPEEALRAIDVLKSVATKIKVGKWNHDARASRIDWPGFVDKAAAALVCHDHLFKIDLLLAAGYEEEQGLPGVWRRPLGTMKLVGGHGSDFSVARKHGRAE